MTSEQGSKLPFKPSPEERLIVFKFACMSTHVHYGLFTVFARSSALVSIARERRGMATPQPIPWHEWGPSNTRWFRNLFSNPLVCDVHGQRYVTLVSNHDRRIVILDFNPYRTRRAAGLDEEQQEGVEGTSVERVVIGPSIIALPAIFRKPFTAALPYLEIKIPSLRVPREGSVMLDDERVIIFDVSALYSICAMSLTSLKPLHLDPVRYWVFFR